MDNTNLIVQLKALETENQKLQAQNSTLVKVVDQSNTLLRMQREETHEVSSKFKRYMEETELKLAEASKREKYLTDENKKLQHKLVISSLRQQNHPRSANEGRFDWFPRDGDTANKGYSKKSAKPKKQQQRGRRDIVAAATSSASGRAVAAFTLPFTTIDAVDPQPQVNDEIERTEKIDPENPNSNERDSGISTQSSPTHSFAPSDAFFNLNTNYPQP